MTRRRGARAVRRLRVVISAGPTREPLDPVRFLSNYSTGYMGAVLAEGALARGHRVTVVCGATAVPIPAGARVVSVERASQMEARLRQAAPRADVIIMAAAVSDYRLRDVGARKRPRRGRLTLRLEATPDIVARLPRRRGQLVAGFAVEARDVLGAARRKLRAKRLDLLLAQRLNGRGEPFGRRSVTAWLLSAPGRESASRAASRVTVRALGRASKRRVARALLDKLEGLWYGQRRSER